MKKKNMNTYGVKLTGLWLSLWLMKLFAFFDAKKSAESIQSHLNEAMKKVTSVINRICKSFIAFHRDLIVGAFLNRNSKSSEEISMNTTDGAQANESIIQRKRAIQNEANARSAARTEKTRKAVNDATLLTYENELTDFVNSIVDKANSYINGYMRKIERKNPEVSNKVKNPFDEFVFNTQDFNLRLEESNDV